jgi:hypothetical protein
MSSIAIRPGHGVSEYTPALPAVPGHLRREERMDAVDAEREQRLDALRQRWETGRQEIKKRWAAYLHEVSNANRQPGQSIDLVQYELLVERVEADMKQEQEELKISCTTEMTEIRAWGSTSEGRAYELEDWQIDLGVVDEVEAVRGAIRSMAGTEAILARYEGHLVEVIHGNGLLPDSPVADGDTEARQIKTAAGLMELLTRIDVEQNTWFFWRWNEGESRYDRATPKPITLRTVMSDQWWSGLPDLSDLLGAGAQNISSLSDSQDSHPGSDLQEQVRGSFEPLTSLSPVSHYPTSEMLQKVLPFTGSKSQLIETLGVTCNTRNLNTWLEGPGYLMGVKAEATKHRTGKNRQVVFNFTWDRHALPPGSGHS